MPNPNPIDTRNSDQKIKQCLKALSGKTAEQWDEAIINVEGEVVGSLVDFQAIRDAFITIAAAVRGDNITPP